MATVITDPLLIIFDPTQISVIVT